MFMALATLIAVKCLSATYPVLASVSRSYPGHMGRLPTCYSPVRHQIQKSKLSFLSFDLHVLGMPPAFILSQDQTLHLIQLLDVSDIFLYNCLFFEIDVLVCILFPVQFSKIMCTSAVLIYITKSFPSCKPLFLKILKKRKEDSFSSVKPTRIFSLPKFVFDTKNDSRYQFYCLLFLQKYQYQSQILQALKIALFTLIQYLKKSFFSMTKVTNFIVFLVK